MSDVLDKEDPIVAAKIFERQIIIKEHYFTSTSPCAYGTYWSQICTIYI